MTEWLNWTESEGWESQWEVIYILHSEDLLWSLTYTVITNFDGNDLGTLYFHQEAPNSFSGVFTFFQWLLVIRNSHLPSQ